MGWKKLKIGEGLVDSKDTPEGESKQILNTYQRYGYNMAVKKKRELERDRNQKPQNWTSKLKDKYKEYQANAPAREAAKERKEIAAIERREKQAGLLERKARVSQREFRANKKIQRSGGSSGGSGSKFVNFSNALNNQMTGGSNKSQARMSGGLSTIGNGLKRSGNPLGGIINTKPYQMFQDSSLYGSRRKSTKHKRSGKRTKHKRSGRSITINI